MLNLFHEVVSKSLTHTELYKNWIVQKTVYEQDPESVDYLWFQILPGERFRIRQQLVETVDKLFNYISELLETRAWQYLPEFLTRILWSEAFFIKSVHLEGLSDATEQVEIWLDYIVEFTLDVAKHLRLQEQAEVTIYRCYIFQLQMIGIFKNDQKRIEKRKKKAQEIIKLLTNPTLVTEAQSELDKTLKSLNESQDTQKHLDWKAWERHFRDQAATLGIDLSLADKEVDPADQELAHKIQIARLIAIGIADLNPTRVLKNCQHLVHQYSGGISTSAQMLQLHTARRKMIGCTIHLEHGAVDTYSLDECYAAFAERFCRHCPDTTPHDSSWEFTEEWQEEQLKLVRKAREKQQREDHTDNTE